VSFLALALVLKDRCIAAWANDPPRAAAAAAALATLAGLAPYPAIQALADWAAGMVEITSGAMEHSLARLDAAAASFAQLADHYSAASVQVGKLIPLALLGRYEEAEHCGLEARDTLLTYNDELAAGKVEQNLGNLAWRRDRYQEAEQFHRAARARFAAAGADDLLVAAENGLAQTLAAQLRVREAADHFERALALARNAGLDVRQAEIECNIGNLALAQGRYNHALDLLERSRRRYLALDMPHESAFAEQELAEAYLGLNLAAEAAAIYARVTPTFAALELRAEQAWALAHHGYAAMLLGDFAAAAERFAAARTLFLAEDNPVNVALVQLYAAQLAYQQGDYATTIAETRQVEPVFIRAGSFGRALLAGWLQGEALRALSRLPEAHNVLEATLHAARARRLPQIAQRCHTALGLIAVAGQDQTRARHELAAAIALIEELRAPLPSDEIRTAFVADKLGPYAALIRLLLDADPPQAAEALAYAERARARALVEMLGGALPARRTPRDAFEAQALEQLAELREGLNWLYIRQNQEMAADNAQTATFAGLQTAIQEREQALLELGRQLQLRGDANAGDFVPFDLAALQSRLGTDTALLAYFSLDDELLAFLVTDNTVEVYRNLAGLDQVEDMVARLRFQIDAMRRGARLNAAHHAQLLRRVHHYLAALHQQLLAPIEAGIGIRRLVFVPHRTLHYVPFQALYDGSSYLIERREICTVPGANVLQHCLDLPRHAYRRALLMGVPDALAPHVHAEVNALAPLFPGSTLLIGAAADSAALQRYAPQADLLHLACHGSFRPDNPLFSALHLADGRFTTRDAYELDLRCNLVVLSACETGVSTIAPGDELLGLARGFLAAGAPSLLLSLWVVDDAGTAELMRRFYRDLLAGATPAAALRRAQCEMLEITPHPFFWAPFTLMGRW
jgi:CHAT domain-containing protein/tetratricopeptide (TPR) repeat protein